MDQPSVSPPSYPAQRTRILTNMHTLQASQPAVMRAFTALHQATTSPGALDTKTKELIALAIGVAARCDGCLAFHTHDALKAGATAAEIMETLGVAILMGGGPSMMYATHVVEALQQFQESGQ